MDCVNSINLFFNKLFKNRLFTITLLIFSIFLFNPLDSFAATPSDLDIWLYFTDGTNTKCTDLNYCFTTNSQPLINRVSIKTQSYSIIEGSKYDVYSSVKLWLLRDNLDIRNDFYIGNFAGDQWNNQSNVSWNNLDSSEYDSFGGFYILNWGLVQNFTSSFSSSGITFDFYFNNPTRLSRIEVTRFELLNTGNTTADSINNMSNTIINNNNQNTQQIIDTVLKDDYFNKSELEQYFITIKNDIEQSNPVSDLLLMPITLLNAYNEGISSTCSPINLGNLLGTDLILPCIDIRKYLGSELYNLIDILFSVFLFYEIAMLCISIFESITTLDDGFQLLYSPKHGDMSRVGRGHSRGLY